jgi:SAM-dependent methyltransferase
MMDVAEFDRFADEYYTAHAANIRLSGEDPEYFARYKVEETRRRWDAAGKPPPGAILDFGVGIGNSTPHLARLFPEAALTGLDVSQRSLAVAEQRFPGLAHLVRYDGRELPFEPGSFDLIFSACVFHHIDPALHAGIFAQLRRALRPDGWLVVFEHNPLNPGTRHIVATCAFDENAVLRSAGQLTRSQVEGGLSHVETTYTSFFPGPLRTLRPLERFLGRVPLGAQYYTVAHG